MTTLVTRIAASCKGSQQIHLLDHRHCEAANVDRASAAALSLCQFDDGGRNPLASEPVGQRGAGDTRSDDQHAPHAHVTIVDR